jgi:hypothetical protein
LIWLKVKVSTGTTISFSIVGLALDLVPPAKGLDILVTVIKNTKRLCGGEVANRLVKIAWEMASDKTKRNTLLKMSGFMATEIDLLPRLLKNADDMTEFGKFFAKYGNEAEGLLKKFGDDLADEMFEVYKKGGDLKETLKVCRNGDDSVIWLEKGLTKAEAETIGKNPSGWRHILEGHPVSQWQDRYPGVTENGLQTELLKLAEQIPRSSIGGKATFTINGGPVSIVTGSNGYIVTAFPGL